MGNRMDKEKTGMAYKMGKHPCERGAPYWICNSCIALFGGETWKTGNTLAMMECGYCNDGVVCLCTPVVDIGWPKKQP